MKVAGEELIPDPELEKFTSVPPFNESQTCTAVVPEEFQLIASAASAWDRAGIQGATD